MRSMMLRVLPVAVVVLFAAYLYSGNDLPIYLTLGAGLLLFALVERAQYERLLGRLDADQKLKQRYVALTLAPIAVVVIWVAAFRIVLTEIALTSAMDFTRIGIPVLVGMLAVVAFYRLRLIARVEKSG